MVVTASRTHVLAEHTSAASAASLPPEVIAYARRVFSDTVAIVLRASRTRALRTLADAVPAIADGGATVIGTPKRAWPDHAALVNGTGGHHIELDDSHGPSRTHAASVLTAAALAAAEVSEVSGADVLAAFVAGYDVQARVSKAMGVQAQFDRGFHPTAVCGAIGAAAVASRIFGLDADRTAVAFGLAASQSSGLTTFEDDETHMTKSFQTGMAARNGMTAALLARAGYQGAREALDGRHNVLRPFGGDAADPRKLTEELGTRHEILSTSLKRHACCNQIHAAIDGILGILEERPLAADDIEAIEIEVAHNAVPIIDGNPLWTHNAQHVAAITVQERRVWLEHFDERWTSDPAVRALAKRVTVRGNDELERAFPAKKGAVVTIRAKGEALRRRVPAPLGHPQRPIPDAALDEKFRVLASAVIGQEKADRLRDLLARLDTLPSIAPVAELLRTEA